MMNGFILQENTSILISRNGKTLYSILHRSLDLTIYWFLFYIIQKVPIKFYYNVYYYYLFKNLDVIYVIYRIKYDLLVTYL